MFGKFRVRERRKTLYRGDEDLAYQCQMKRAELWEK